MSRYLLLTVNVSCQGLSSILTSIVSLQDLLQCLKNLSRVHSDRFLSYTRKREISQNDQLLSFVVTCCHSLSFAVTRCHSLLFVVYRCHSLSLILVVPLVVIRCHSFHHSCHLLSLVVTGCINDHLKEVTQTDQLLVFPLAGVWISKYDSVIICVVTPRPTFVCCLDAHQCKIQFNTASLSKNSIPIIPAHSQLYKASINSQQVEKFLLISYKYLYLYIDIGTLKLTRGLIKMEVPATKSANLRHFHF